MDALTVADLSELAQVDDGRNKAREGEKQTAEHMKRHGVRGR